MSEIGLEAAPDSASPDPRERLTLALEEAAHAGAPESVAVCDAVNDVVDEAKRAGEPPERVIVLLKRLALPLLEAGKLPMRTVQAFVAWVVRCAVRAYYRDAQRG
jgi:hypothetical protein